MKILMVCLGNICRSPLAEGLLKEKTREMDVVVDSAGTSGYHIDEAPDPRMIKTARKYGINLSELRGRQFNTNDFDEFDLIYVMDASNYQNVIAMARNDEDRKKVQLLLNELEEEMDKEVPDPYFGGDQGFENVYQMLDKATDIIVKKIKNGEYSKTKW